MRRFPKAIAAFLLTAALAGTAAAEKTLPVNDPSAPGVFDQPSAAVSGSTVHVACIGAASAAGPFRVYYAAIGGGTNFSDLTLTRARAGFLLTPLTALDNAAAGNNAYVDARHPQIAMLSSREAVILFQAKPAASPDPSWVLYLARLSLDNNAVVRQTVRMVTGIGGFQEDPSFALVATDNTARAAYAGRPATAGEFQVYYARISLASAAVTGFPGTAILLSSAAGSAGSRPLPSLKLDPQRRAHVAWAANDNTLSPNGIYYAMVKEANGAETAAIAATEILGRSRKWGFPNLLVSSASSILIFAADESLPGTAGNVGMVNLNPSAAAQDGNPVQISLDTRFLLTPPGEAILPDGFNVFRPAAFLDALGQVHMTGYGSGGTRSTYYAFKPSKTYPYASFAKTPSPVGLDSTEFPVSLDGDHTRAAFGFLSGGKAVVFWSGDNTVTGNRNLDVTGIPTASAIPVDESGCAVAAHPAKRPKSAADALLPLLPLAFLGIRRIASRALGN
ncbi:MAG TPA: hypothetical protein VE080_01580 [Candidatus Aquicultoraceae bacterium]|nr:hypothetical protein [Candidatus Aquicultoraceae bacterium]